MSYPITYIFPFHLPPPILLDLDWDWEWWNQFPPRQVQTARAGRLGSQSVDSLGQFKALQWPGWGPCHDVANPFFKTKLHSLRALGRLTGRRLGLHRKPSWHWLWLNSASKDPIDIGPVLILSALLIPLILSTKQILRNYLVASCFIEYLLTDLIA